ncbi:Aspartyl/asparaginyl-tRNA synthetase [Pseudomonas syringae pv. actinidiae]|nr:Aspartyl/asparaginyl-tRNA synthetase [Pseudomonas syringae pv. actinidiae]
MLFQGLGRVAQSACGIDHVINQNAGTPFDIADDMHHFRVIGFLTAFVDDTEIDAQGLCNSTCTHDTADIRGNDHQVFKALVFDVIHQNGGAVDVIYRNIEETLDLVSMKINRENTVDSHHGQHIGNDFRADSNTCGARTAILAGITKVGNHSSDSGR